MSRIECQTELSKIDASILSLEVWHVISYRTRNCLGQLRQASDPTSTVAGVAIGQMWLSDLSRCEQRDITRLPNLGRICYCEIAAVMDRYGWRFHDRWTGEAERPALDLMGASLSRTLRAITRAAEKRAERFALGQTMMRLHDVDGLTGAEIGKRFAISGAAAYSVIQKTRNILELRTQLPLAAAPSRH